jgi:ribosomal-protein-alanine N-acetyltransferase
MIKIFDEIPLIHGSGVVLRRIEQTDREGLEELVSNDKVYKYLPTFLYEKQDPDLERVIDGLYGELFTSRESLILGICSEDDDLCGLAEFYGLRDELHKISIGYRLSERFWGKGLATATVGAMVSYLYGNTDIEIITASTMVENSASARVLKKNGFDLVASSVGEDWGYDEPTIADKWIR